MQLHLYHSSIQKIRPYILEFQKTRNMKLNWNLKLKLSNFFKYSFWLLSRVYFEVKNESNKAKTNEPTFWTSKPCMYIAHKQTRDRTVYTCAYGGLTNEMVSYQPNELNGPEKFCITSYVSICFYILLYVT